MQKNKKLTNRQRAFIQEYLLDLNASQAAIRAGYSPKSARWTGRDNMSNPLVRQAIEQAQAERVVRTGISQDRVLKELALIAFGDLRDVLDWGPDGVELKPSSALSAAGAVSIAEISESAGKEGGRIKVKRYDKVKALELLGRHLGLFSCQVDVSGKIDLAKAIEDGRKRATNKS